MKFLGAAPSNAADLVTKAYADSLSSGGSSSGMLQPVQVHTNGKETYTISGGSITAISGPQIQSYNVAVGDRILVMTSPSASGTTSWYSRTTQPGNGIYVATAVGSTISVSRAADFSGSVNPAGLMTYSENISGDWLNNGIFAVNSPSWPGGFTAWGTTNIYFVGVAGATLNPIDLFVNSGIIGMWNSTPGVPSYLQVNPATASGPAQNVTLPVASTCTLATTADVAAKLARTVVSVNGVLTFGTASGTEYVYLLKSGAVPTMPTAVGNAAFYRVKNTTTAPITLLSAGGTVDGSTSISLRPGVSVDIVSDGTNYFVI